MYRIPKNKASQSLIDILHYKGIANRDREEIIRTLTLFAEKKVDIADCILCVKAAGSNTALFSFDDTLNKICDFKR